MSQNMESETEYFSIDFYKKIVYQNGLLDVAKLFDLAAIYGNSNPQEIKTLIETIFETDLRFEQDFKEAFDMMINIFKRIFKDAVRLDEMIRGEAIIQKGQTEQEEIMQRLLEDLIEILTNFHLVSRHFGDAVVGSISNTNFLVNLANCYCMLRKIKKLWVP